MPLVLIVEDDAAVLRLVRLFLETSGYDTRAATNGFEALEEMRHQLPCLVLLDMMTLMDGLEFRRQQLKDHALAGVPVVCLTGHYEPEQVGMKIGLPCLKKPLHFPTVLDAVENRCGPGRQSVVRETSRDSPIVSDDL